MGGTVCIVIVLVVMAIRRYGKTIDGLLNRHMPDAGDGRAYRLRGSGVVVVGDDGGTPFTYVADVAGGCTFYELPVC